eukprot:m.36926 g.36926  ORF g.36926 m.36926 type:complete len:285 (+) comp16120_c0_seq2:3-857(+)
MTPTTRVSFLAGTFLGAVCCWIFHSFSRKSSVQHDSTTSLHHFKPKMAERGRADVPVPSDREHDHLDPYTKERRKINYVYRVVLTGGPCGGKSSSLSQFTQVMKTKGYDVYAAPEIPTILLNAGCKYPGDGSDNELIEFELNLLEMQLQMERTMVRIAASTGRKSIVVFDRGLMDIAAYLSEDQWRALLARGNFSEDEFLERYNLVLHLVTAALGAEQFYTTANNTARHSTIERARMLDVKVRHAWRNHPNLQMIDNSTNFQGKLDRATSAVQRMVDQHNATAD